ncbi:MAG: TrkA family potassium uptake protein [bacterium]
MKKERVFAIFGMGTFGSEVAEVLATQGGKIIAVDNRAKTIEKMKEKVTQAMIIDSTDEESLKNLPLEDIDVAVIAIGEQIEASILTTALLKKLGIPYIIARAITDIHAQVLKQVGASEVINIELDEGRRLAQRLIAPDIIERIPISKNQTLAEIVIPKEFVGKTLLTLDLRKKLNINVISVKRTITDIDDLGNPVKEEQIITPQPDHVLEDKDILVIIGSDADINTFKDL